MMKCFISVIVIFVFVLGAVTAQQQCNQLDAQVLILGAGMSGMNAANTLYEAGVTDFLIIEAKPQIGGRIMHAPIREGGANVEIGANWIHEFDPDQPELQPLYALAQRCGGIQGNISNYTSIVVYNNTGGFVPDESLDFLGILAAYENVQAISMSRQANGESDISLRQALTESGWTVVSDEDKLLDWFFADYGYAVPPENISIFNFDLIETADHVFTDYIGDSSNSEDFLVTDQMGYVKLVECLADGILGVNNSRLLLNTKVSIIKWSDECVCVDTYYNDQMQQYCANYAIITFSIGVLQSQQIEFQPELPQWKSDVINMFSMAHYLKMFAEFPTVFWDDIQFTGRVSDVRGYFPIFLSQNLFLPAGNNVLHITATGEIADRLFLQNENDTINELMTVLRGIYGSNISDPTAFFRSPWLTDPYVLGSYSSVPLGVTRQTFIDLAAPVGRAYFSGEATNSDYNTAVHGAYFAGRDSANAVIIDMSAAEAMTANLILVLCGLFLLLL